MYKTRTRILQGWNAGETVPKAVGCLDNGDPADGFQDQSESHGGYCGRALSNTFTSFFFLENLGSYKNIPEEFCFYHGQVTGARLIFLR